MRAFVLLSSACLLFVSACTRSDRYEKALKSFPEPERTEGTLRLEECDELADTIAPSTDKSGEAGLLGASFGLRVAEFKNTSAKDQYLIALLGTIRVCRKWAIFEASDDDFDDAFLRMADIAGAAYDGDKIDIDAKLQDLLDAYKANDRLPRSNPVVQTDLDGFRALATEQSKMTDQLAVIETLLRDIRDIEARIRAVGAGSGTANSFDSPTASSREISEKTWTFGFRTASTHLDPRRVEASRTEISEFTRSCKHWRGTVIGFADTRGDEASNAALSIARADEVIQQLGLDNMQLARSGGSGETEIFGDDYEANRVVTVTLWCADK